ncbi:unnamed protein product, partial [marine sediment metagenome]
MEPMIKGNDNILTCIVPILFSIIDIINTAALIYKTSS